MFLRIQDGQIQETGPFAVYEGSARLKMSHFDSVLGEENYFSRDGPFCSGELRISPFEEDASFVLS